MGEANDHEVLAETKQKGAVLISADTDFGELPAHSNTAGPSVILLRRQQGRRTAEVAALILANLNAVADDLESGASINAYQELPDPPDRRSGHHTRRQHKCTIESSIYAGVHDHRAP